MMLTDLAKAARKSGLTVVEQPGWKKRGVGQMVAVKTITCHHTATPASAKGNYPSMNVVTNGRADLRGPLANLGLGRDGTVYVIAAGYANHAGPSLAIAYTSPYAIGIEAEHPGVGKWPDVQYDAYVALCRALIDHYGLPVTAVMGHKETRSPRGAKVDPNFDMTAFRAAVATHQEDIMPPLTKAQLQKLVRVQTRRAWVGKRGNLRTWARKALTPIIRAIVKEEVGK